MCNNRLLASTSALAVLALASSAHAQNAPRPTRPPVVNFLTPHDSRTETPSHFRFRTLPATRNILIASLNPPALAQTGDDPSSSTIVARPAQTYILLPKKQSICYAIRSYQFAQAEPGSGDGVVLKGSSTCQAASSLQLRSIHVVPVR